MIVLITSSAHACTAITIQKGVIASVLVAADIAG